MLEQLFKGLFDTELTAVISVADFLLCLGFSLLLGLLLALAYSTARVIQRASWSRWHCCRPSSAS